MRDLPAPRELGFQANRRLLHVQKISHACAIGEDAFRRVKDPAMVDGKRVNTLRFADVAVQPLLSALPVFRLLPYRVTAQGWRTALFCTRIENRVLHPGLAEIIPGLAAPETTLRRRFDQLDVAIDEWIEQQTVPA